MSNIDEQADPTESYVAPPRLLNGVELKEFSMGNRALVGLIGDPSDSDDFWLQCVLFVLSHDRAHVQKISRNKDKARVAVLDWIDTLNFSLSEMIEAVRLADVIVTESKKDKVDPLISAASGNE